MIAVIEAVQNIFNVPDLRKRIVFMLALARGVIGSERLSRRRESMPTPWSNFFNQTQGTVFGFLDMFSGGNFRRLTIFALGIMPYITASIILQLLAVVWPYLEKLSKEGDLGRRKITTYTRYLTVVLSAIQSFGIAVALATRRHIRDHAGNRILVDDDADANHRKLFHHVAGRTDLGSRHRQRDVADHLCRYRRGAASGNS